jgi:hypothetical protein
MRRSFAPGVSKLDAESRRTAKTSGGVQRALERRLIVIAVQPKTRVRDTTTPFHGRGFDHDEPCTGICELREVLQVPVGRGAVTRAVLTHRRNDEAIRQLDSADCDRLEQTAGHERSGAM